MEIFPWNANFHTGLSRIDEQHRTLLDLFNELNVSLFSFEENRDAMLQKTYDRVIDYASNHFSEEESVMLAEGVDPRHLEVHHLEHKEFVTQVESMWMQQAILVEHPESIVGFLTSWLGLHILGTDKSMARQIDRIRLGVPASEAFEYELSSGDKDMQELVRMIGKLYRVLSTQNSALAEANAHLEERVAQRTRELEAANTRLHETNNLLERQSQTDGLLQIANRGYFERRLQEACADAFRSRSSMGLLMIDVDFFKRYNDCYGHQAGDACLTAVTQAVCNASLRATDLVARYGGEEFAVILPETDREGTRNVAHRIAEGVANLALAHECSDVSTYVTVSIGAVCGIPEFRNDGARLVAKADAALYQAKEQGRNQIIMSEQH